MTVIGVHSRHNHRHNVALTSASSHGFKYMVVGLVVGLVVGMQVMLVQVNKKGEPFVNSSGHASAASTALFGGEPELRLEHRVEQAVAAAEREVREQEAAGRWAHQPANFPKSLPEGALEHEVSS